LKKILLHVKMCISKKIGRKVYAFTKKTWT